MLDAETTAPTIHKSMEEHFYSALEPGEREEIAAQGLSFNMLFELYRDDPRLMPMYYASMGADISAFVTVDTIDSICDALLVAFNNGYMEEVIVASRSLFGKIGLIAMTMPTAQRQEQVRRKCFSLATVVGAELTRRGIR